MTHPDYNLLDESWIPVLLLDGTVEQIGIREIFRRSEEIEDLACELPTQKIAIQRILLAICYRTIDVPDLDVWKELWNSGLPEEAIQSYLDRWEDRFYLFGGRHPFMQAPDLRTSKDVVSGLEKIIADVPNGEPFFTTKAGSAIAIIPPNEAAIWLIHAHAFDIAGIHSGAADDPEAKGGKGYSIGPSWTGQLGLIWLKGNNLEESLLLNLVATDRTSLKGPLSTGPLGACSWESEDIEIGTRMDYSKEGNPDPAGYAISRLLTWHSRRIRLHGDRHGVTGVVNAQGDKLGPENMHAYEPMSVWRYSESKSKIYKEPIYMPRKHEIGRAFWRNLPGALSFDREIIGVDKQKHYHFLPSATIEFHKSFDGLSVSCDYPIRIRLEVVGVSYGSNDSVIDDIYHDEVTLAFVLLKENHQDLYELVVNQVKATEEVARAIGLLAANLSRAAGQRGDGAGDGPRESAQARFYALVDEAFRRWLAQVNSDSDAEEEGRRWEAELRCIALSLTEDLISRAPIAAVLGRKTGTVYMSSAIAESGFRKVLNKVAPPVVPHEKGEEL